VSANIHARASNDFVSEQLAAWLHANKIEPEELRELKLYNGQSLVSRESMKCVYDEQGRRYTVAGPGLNEEISRGPLQTTNPDGSLPFDSNSGKGDRSEWR
jgi:hypothetical protein